MPRAHSKRATITLLLCSPAAALAILTAASFTWVFLWAPPSTPAFQSAQRRAILHVGSFHYTNGPAEFTWRTAHPNIEMQPVIGYSPQRDVPWPGVDAFRSPAPFISANWETFYRPGNFQFPLLPVATAALLPALIYWLSTRPRKAGVCTNCGYSRAGLTPQTTCPECGHVT